LCARCRFKTCWDKYNRKEDCCLNCKGWAFDKLMTMYFQLAS
jgi:hypothetical protein